MEQWSIKVTKNSRQQIAESEVSVFRFQYSG
jgi:hypothetical protein